MTSLARAIVATPTTEAKAEAVAAALRDRGFDAAWEASDYPDHYYVTVGEAERQQAGFWALQVMATAQEPEPRERRR